MQGGKIGPGQRRIGNDQRQRRSHHQDDATRRLAVEEFAKDGFWPLVPHVFSVAGFPGGVSDDAQCLTAGQASYFPSAGAAPHLPAGILSPYSDGERDAVMAGFANRKRRKKNAGVAASPFSPSLYGEKVPAGG